MRARHVAVDARRRRCEARAADRQRRHVEVVAASAARASAEELLARRCRARCAAAVEVRSDLARGEVVVARRHRRVRREHGARRDRLERRVEIQALLSISARMRSSTEERGVALVHVPDRRLEPSACERAHAADAEHDLLLDARARGRRRRGGAGWRGPRAVALAVGVEQVQRDAADLRAARPCSRRRARRELDLHLERAVARAPA